MKKNRVEIIDYINTLKGYEGYVQFSHRPIDIEKDVFKENDPKVEDEKGFIYEAHFANKTDSIGIRQMNDTWFISKTNISNAEIESFEGIAHLKIKMAQIWEKELDSLCEDMEVLKLKKVVFAGFNKGESK